MAKIENHKYSIQEAFRDCFYIIPDYQREYVWTDREVVQLLNDIAEQVDGSSAREYFVGMVLVSPGSDKQHFEVIDGQQRLTTFFLLLCALRRRFEGQPQTAVLDGLLAATHVSVHGDARTTLRLDPQYENATAVVRQIVGWGGEPERIGQALSAAGVVSFGSLGNLVDAYQVICRYLADNYEDAAELRKFWGYLANNVIFIQISADISSALKIFETINERGVGLNPMDLLKNLLFTQVQPAEFAQLKNEWKQITKPLEKKKEKPLRFLRYFLMANYRSDVGAKDGVVREDGIYDWLTERDNAALCGYQKAPFDFVRKVSRNVELYLGFIDGRDNLGQKSRAMEDLHSLTGGGFSLHYILLLAAARFPPRLFEHFVRQLEAFLFYYIFTKTATKELERSFSTWADELREIAEESDEARQVQRLNQFMDRRFKGNMTTKQAELRDALKRYTLHSMQRYRTRYLLAKIAQFVEMSFKGLPEPGPLNDYLELEIEHILPDRPGKDLLTKWKQSNEGMDYDDCKVRLGNLTLLEKPMNVVAGNDFFEEKKKTYQRCGNYLTRSIVQLAEVGANTSVNRISKRLQCFSSWNAKEIEGRQEMLIKLAADVWRVATLESGRP